jgi:RNA polymerase-associated protein CTR9
LRVEAEALAAERARARQEAQQWSADLVKNESDEEREQRKARRAASRKVKSEATSGDEGLSTPGAVGGAGGGAVSAGGAEPKKKRRKLKKGGGVASAGASTQASDAEDGGALFSEGEEEKPIKKVLCFISFIFSFSLMGWVWIRSARGDEETRCARRRRRNRDCAP